MVRPDIYSYLTGDIPWVNHEWLSEAIMAIAYTAAGVTGLIALKTLLGLGVALLAARHLLRQRLALLTAIFLTSYGMVVLYPGLRPIRPQAFTYVGAALVLLLIDGRHRWSLWWAAPIMALWANLHGGFVAGLGLLVVWWGSRVCAAWIGVTPIDAVERRAIVRDGLAVAAAVAATLVNPYGWEMWWFLGRTLKPRPEISEWTALPIASLEGVTYLLVAALGVIGLLGQTFARRAVTLPLLLCGLLLPLLARRHLPLLALIVLILFAGDAAHVLGAVVQRRWPRMQRASTNRFRPLLAGALVLEAVVILAIASPEWRRIAVDPAAYPVAATRLLAETRLPANLAVFFDWGEYVLWHLGPRIKVSVDGRRETVYPDDVYAENMALTEGAGDWDRLLTQRPTDLALVSLETPAAALLALHPGWELILRDGPSALYARRGSPIAAELRASPPVPRSPAPSETFP
jgi:hypothetical protein